MLLVSLYQRATTFMFTLPWPVLWLWALPQTLAGLILLPFYGVLHVDWSEGVLFVTVRRLIGFSDTTGQTFGRVVFQRADADPWNSVHEIEHVAQSALLGPLFPLAYLVAGIVADIRGQGFYRGNFFEVSASAYADDFIGRHTAPLVDKGDLLRLAITDEEPGK